MAEYLSPGVYVEEIEMGAKPIEGVGTSTAGFVGVTEKQDLLNIPTLIKSWGDYVSKFGRYTENSGYLAPAVQSFFINGGKRCYVVAVEDINSLIGSDDGEGNRTGLESLIGEKKVA